MTKQADTMNALTTIDLAELSYVTGGEDAGTWAGLAGRVLGCAAVADSVKDFGSCVLDPEAYKKGREG